MEFPIDLNCITFLQGNWADPLNKAMGSARGGFRSLISTLRQYHQVLNYKLLLIYIKL